MQTGHILWKRFATYQELANRSKRDTFCIFNCVSRSHQQFTKTPLYSSTKIAEQEEFGGFRAVAATNGIGTANRDLGAPGRQG
jgi:hypothetical protein